MTLETDRESVLSRELHNFALDQGIVGADGRALIAWPGRHFDPASVPGNAQRSDGPNANVYLRVDGFGAPPQSVTVDRGESMYQWVQQVSVCIRTGLGETRAFEIAGGLRELFWYPRRLIGEHTYVVERTPHVAGSLQDDGWLVIPVSIRLRAFA